MNHHARTRARTRTRRRPRSARPLKPSGAPTVPAERARERARARVRGRVRSGLALMVLVACGGKGSTNPMGSGSPLSDQAMVQLKDAPDGLDMRVSDGKQGPPAFDRAK